MKIKRFLSVFLCTLLCISLFPTKVCAAEGYNVLVANTWITEDNAEDVLNDGGTVVYERTTNTLTLNDATINGAIYCETNCALNVVVNGTNEMNCTGNVATGISNFNNMPINILGSGKLKITVEIKDGNAIRGNNVTIDGVELELYTSGTALSGYPLTIKNRANVTAVLSGDSNSVAVEGGVVEISDSTLTATSPLGNSIFANSLDIKNSTITGIGYYPILTGNGGDITITDSTIIAECEADWGIWANGNLTIRGKSDVTSTGSIAAIGGWSFTLEPPEGELIDVFVGTDKENASAIDGSPISQAIDLSSYGNNSIKYFHSAPHKHIYDQKVVSGKYQATTANCEKAAQYYYSCVCGAIGTSTFENGDPTGHTWGSWVSNGDNTHSRVCSVCQDTETQSCNGGIATCVKQAVCDICGEGYGNVDFSNHENLIKIDAQPATHLLEGHTEYWYCDVCDKYFSDATGTVEIELNDTVISKLMNHTVDSTGWHYDENNHWNICECDAKLNEASHTFAWVTDKAATATETGTKHEECTICGYAKASVEIPATGTATDPSDKNENSPIGTTDTKTPTSDNQTGDKTVDTGDYSYITLWMTIMLGASVVLISTVLYNRKKKYNQ